MASLEKIIKNEPTLDFGGVGKLCLYFEHMTLTTPEGVIMDVKDMRFFKKEDYDGEFAKSIIMTIGGAVTGYTIIDKTSEGWDIAIMRVTRLDTPHILVSVRTPFGVYESIFKQSEDLADYMFSHLYKQECCPPAFKDWLKSIGAKIV